MTKKVSKPTEDTRKHVFVVFGLDESGKPKAARFTPNQFEPASHAATSMNLHICEAASAELVELAKKLPSGRIYARGRAFIPFIKRDLYDRLHAASGGLVRDGQQPKAGASVEAPVATDSPPSSAEPQPVVTGLPCSWETLAPGHMVLAFEGPGEGWWESVVVSRYEQMLTLRYRDYPKLPKFDRHISTVALINPGPE